MKSGQKGLPLAILLSFLAYSSLHAAAPVVSSVRASQRPGTKLVDVDYELADPDSPILTVSIAVSTDGGASYTLPATSFSGAVGSGVARGTGKRITWNAGQDWPNRFSANVRFRVTADDATAPSGMVLIPAGVFTMGDTFNEGYSDERPTHTVYVSAFYMDKYEVTKALWDDIYSWATTHGYSFEHGAAGKAANHPAQSMTWYDAVKWCNARSEKEGRTPACYTSAAQTTVYRSGQVDVQNDWVNWNSGYRLPTEEECEKAARGGATGHRFPWTGANTITHSRANYYSQEGFDYDISPTRQWHPTYEYGSSPYTSPVGSFAANGYGLSDMAGNVSEWVWRWEYFGSQVGHGIRGGSWTSLSFDCRSASRFIYISTDYRGGNTGFRSVLSLTLTRGESGVITVDTRDNLLTVSGRVLNAASRAPISGAAVSLGGQNTSTLGNGTFSLANVVLADGNTLTVSKSGYATYSGAVAAPPGVNALTVPDVLLQLVPVNKPVVTGIRAKYDGLFLSGASILNQYTASVEWNGQTPASVEFYVNGSLSSTVTTSTTEVTAETDMALGFFGSLTLGANKVSAVAVSGDGTRSAVYDQPVTILPLDPRFDLFTLPFEFAGMGADAGFRFKVEVPPASFPASVLIPIRWFDQVGLKLSGVAELDYRLHSGEWMFRAGAKFDSPKLAWGLWKADIEFTPEAKGVASQTRGFDIDQVGLKFRLDAKYPILVVYIFDLVPGGQVLHVADVLVLVGVDVNSIQRLTVNGLFRLDADLLWNSHTWQFQDALFTPGGGLQALYAPNLLGSSLEIDLTGRLSFPIRLTSPQAWKITGEASLGLKAVLWGMVLTDNRWILLSGEIASSRQLGAATASSIAGAWSRRNASCYRRRSLEGEQCVSTTNGARLS